MARSPGTRAEAGEIEGQAQASVERLRFSASTCFSSTPSDQPQTWEDSILMRFVERRPARRRDRALGAIVITVEHHRGGVVTAVLVEDPSADDSLLPASEIDVDVRVRGAPPRSKRRTTGHFLRINLRCSGSAPRRSRRCRGPGKECPATVQSARSHGQSGSTARSEASR